MGILTDFFAAKEELLRTSDMEAIELGCRTLKEAGMFYQKVRINQETPKCDGNCAGCAAMEQVDEDAPMYKKIGVGCSSDLLNPKGDKEIYAIYVKQSELDKAREILLTVSA